MTRSGSSDEQNLVLKIKQRDAQAMKALYDAEVGYLTSVCSRYIVSDDDVKDVLQESFIKIFTSIDSFEYRGNGSLRSWITRIVVNNSLNWLKQNSKFAQVALDEAVVKDVEAEQEPDISDVSAEEIQRLIRELPEGYRTVFNLYVFERKSHREIADILGIKEKSSASQMHRAKNLLAQKINELKRTKI